MASMTWTDDYSVGIEAIDKQHKRLIELINELSEAMQDGTTREAIGYILTSLIDYTHKHFTFEEDLFEKYGYPESSEHKAAHGALAEKVQTLKKSYAAGDLVMGMEVMNFLKDWLTGHILGTDKKYAKFLLEKGVR